MCNVYIKFVHNINKGIFSDPKEQEINNTKWYVLLKDDKT